MKAARIEALDRVPPIAALLVTDFYRRWAGESQRLEVGLHQKFREVHLGRFGLSDNSLRDNFAMPYLRSICHTL